MLCLELPRSRKADWPSQRQKEPFLCCATYPFGPLDMELYDHMPGMRTLLVAVAVCWSTGETVEVLMVLLRRRWRSAMSCRTGYLQHRELRWPLQWRISHWIWAYLVVHLVARKSVQCNLYVQTGNTASSFGSFFVRFFLLDFYDCTWSLPVPWVPSQIFSKLFHTLGSGELANVHDGMNRVSLNALLLSQWARYSHLRWTQNCHGFFHGPSSSGMSWNLESGNVVLLFCVETRSLNTSAVSHSGFLFFACAESNLVHRSVKLIGFKSR